MDEEKRDKIYRKKERKKENGNKLCFLNLNNCQSLANSTTQI